jgi:hypothetical protein
LLLHLLQVLHVVTAVLMAWPFYALLMTGERIRLGAPLDRTDTYMETIIRRQTVRCLVFQLTLLITGLLLVYLRVGPLWVQTLTGGNLRLLGKEILLLLLLGMTLYMYFYLQPRIDQLLQAASADPGAGQEAGRMRGRRRWMAAVCLWYVLVAVILGLQAWQSFGRLFTLVLAGVAALFVWRVHRGLVPWGWV